MTDFSQYSGDYARDMRRSIGFLRTPHDFFIRTKAQEILKIARNKFGDISRIKVLDVGCGTGNLDSYIIPHIGELTGIDISPNLIDQARRQVPAGRFELYDSSQIPFDRQTFDLVFATCVLHHVPPAGRVNLLREMRRVTRPSGLVVIVEHNPINPLTRLAVCRCAFDRGCKLIGMSQARRLVRQAGMSPHCSAYITFFPFDGELWRSIEGLMGNFMAGAQFYVAGSP
ncbi:MAG: class I SAM-dependent methyltransferase [Planctomycetes bacterium]|nr:class I SAM-dependent methyltransferase [Planctomycetota bacterium]